MRPGSRRWRRRQAGSATSRGPPARAPWARRPPTAARPPRAAAPRRRSASPAAGRPAWAPAGGPGGRRRPAGTRRAARRTRPGPAPARPPAATTPARDQHRPAVVGTAPAGEPAPADDQLGAVVGRDHPPLSAGQPVAARPDGHRASQLPLQPGHRPGGAVGLEGELGEQLRGPGVGPPVASQRPPAGDARGPLGHLHHQAAAGNGREGQEHGRGGGDAPGTWGPPPASPGRPASATRPRSAGPAGRRVAHPRPGPRTSACPLAHPS
jgi:translation initiation factor IF-2